MYHGDLDTKGQNNLVRVREMVAVAIIETTVKQRLARVIGAAEQLPWNGRSTRPEI